MITQPSPKPNPYTLLEKGGEWLGATHEYLKWHATRGDSLTWGSYNPVHGLTVHDVELLVAKAIAADRNERIKKT